MKLDWTTARRPRRLTLALVTVSVLGAGLLISSQSTSTAIGFAPVACTVSVSTNPGGTTGTYVDTAVTPNVTYNTVRIAHTANTALAPTVTPSNPMKVEFILVAGGGAGGNARTSGGAGGGGAGGVQSRIGDANAVSFSAARVWTVGIGQNTQQSNQGAGGNGSPSSLIYDGPTTITANGGGGGAGRATAAPGGGGSGGGGGYNNTTAVAPGAATAGQGNIGAAARTTTTGAGGGGGGFGATPAVSVTSGTGGRGGTATTANASLFGTVAGTRSTAAAGYAGGGGGSGITAGGTATAADGSTAGAGGGGAGGATTGTSGPSGFGGGGGASFGNNVSGRGGSGFILARWRKFCLVPSPPTASTVSGSSLAWSGSLAPTYIPVAGISKYRIMYRPSGSSSAAAWKVWAEASPTPTSPVTLSAAANCGAPSGWTCNPTGLAMQNGSTYQIAIVATGVGSGSAMTSAIVPSTGVYTASGA